MTEREIQIIARISAEDVKFGMFPYCGQTLTPMEAFGAKSEAPLPDGLYLYVYTSENIYEVDKSRWINPDYILEIDGDALLLYKIAVE